MMSSPQTTANKGCDNLLIDYKEAAAFLRENDCFRILTHASPDGDTIGSGFGLCAILRKMGKKANVYCADELPKRYDFMYESYEEQIFDYEHIIAVDVADPKLLGKSFAHYADKVELCIDHHISNTGYAERTLVQSDAAAACQVIFKLMSSEKLCECDEKIAKCLYTGIATDTGCFRYDSCSPETHIAAAELMRFNINAGKINRRMFEQKSRARLAAEQHVLGSMEYFCNEKCSVSAISLADTEKAGLPMDEFEGIAGLTTALETIEVGIFIRQKEEKKFKASLRSTGDVDVSAICAKFGGGGHKKAAGCTFETSIDDARDKLVKAVAEVLGEEI